MLSRNLGECLFQIRVVRLVIVFRSTRAFDWKRDVIVTVWVAR
jgi:hypothetical protein